MDKRQFLKSSGAFIAGSIVPRSAVSAEQNAARRNWAGNYTYRAARLDAPRNVEDLQTIVKKRSRLKALGSRHSFNAIADTTGDQISLKYFDQMAVHPGSRTVTVGAAISYGQLGPHD
jgi:xylitol oxidase